MTKNRILGGRRAFLMSLSASVGAGAFAIASKSKQLNSQTQPISLEDRDFAVIKEAPLRDRAVVKDLLYGAASSYYTMSSNPGVAELLAQECAILVPENELKWEALRPAPDRFNFAPADAMASFARAHNMFFRGHALVWYQALPKWFKTTVNSQNAEEILINHIKTVVGHYAGRMHSWDVVNEAIQLSDGRSDGLRKMPWLEFLGPDYIDIAFRTAAQADPQAILVYNENELESDSPKNEAKRAKVLELLERLKSNGTPVHALGIQSHLTAHSTGFKANKLRDFLKDVASLDLKILVTEMDVIEKFPLDVAGRDHVVAGVYEDYLSLILEEPAVIAVLTWGISDRYTWISSYAPRKDGSPVRPLPFDTQLKRKLAWNAIARAFDKAPMH